ncbi:hypothetical protein J4E86_009264 [Alternaria arbusti]|uniref:uncharacterized protein n=1 Tax=Alternaria arbusti TaxID=232088 RepID=UPI0022203247|nr:uncharacterized protein J4E86_009264 [Alternaria arbusti]KAI4945377.1 hypothetical protein J4E86_009264 [Alternaria arbusti]
MRFALSQSDDFLARHDLDRSMLESLAENEERFLADAREKARTAPRINALGLAARKEMVDRELAEFGPAAYPPSSFFETTGSLRPRVPPPTGQQPAPPAPTSGVWEYYQACVVNATNTYWSYGARTGCVKNSDALKDAKEDGKRVYTKQPDGQFRWAAFQQCSPSTVAGFKGLHQIVRAVGGNPANFVSRIEMAKYVIAREAPVSVVQEEDDDEIFSGTFPVHLGQPASENFWGVGQLGNGTLTMAASTQGAMEKYGAMEKLSG